MLGSLGASNFGICGDGSSFVHGGIAGLGCVDVGVAVGGGACVGVVEVGFDEVWQEWDWGW